MSASLDDAEFWLPPEFLTDDDLATDKNNNCKSEGNGFRSNTEATRYLFPLEFSYRFGSFGTSSNLDSPVESVVGSSETESDEDYVAGLTHQLAHSTLALCVVLAFRLFQNEETHSRFVQNQNEAFHLQ
ncbi:hypothetical protein I3760_13G082100 [Carya illinoinensis]|nr:hypothetical protein I3760_13G082100 [Carya illinoinensis]